MNDVGFAEVGGDFAADFVAGVRGFDVFVPFAFELYGADVEFLAFFGLFLFLYWGLFDANSFVCFEESESCFVCLSRIACGGALELHESAA